MFEILSTKTIAPDIFEFEVKSPEIAAKACPGQFLIYRLHDRGERIPLTMKDWDTNKGSITIVFQVVGKSTLELSKLQPGDKIKDIVDTFDRVLMGNKRITEHAYEEWVHNWAKIEGVKAIFEWFETFYDNTKVAGTSTATIHYELRKAYGNGLEYRAEATATGALSQIALRWNSTGTVTVEASLNGSWAVMTTIVNQDTFYTPAVQGTAVRIKVTLTGAAELYSIAAVGKEP